MDNRKIGIFDSGLGGLTAVKELLAIAPNESIAYLGDTARVPYGTRSPETIRKFAREDLGFLLKCDIKAVLIACGTVSSTAASELRKMTSLLVVDIITPTSRAAVKATNNGKIAVLGTKATVASGAFDRAIKEISPSASVFAKACPMFVPLVENGYVKKDCKATELIAREYLRDVIDFGADTVILGCTHFPIISGIISDILGDGVTVINSGAEAAKEIVALTDRGELGIHDYYVTDSVEGFAENASLFLGKNAVGNIYPAKLETE